MADFPNDLNDNESKSNCFHDIDSVNSHVTGDEFHIFNNSISSSCNDIADIDLHKGLHDHLEKMSNSNSCHVIDPCKISIDKCGSNSFDNSSLDNESVSRSCIDHVSYKSNGNDILTCLVNNNAHICDNNDFDMSSLENNVNHSLFALLHDSKLADVYDDTSNMSKSSSNNSILNHQTTDSKSNSIDKLSVLYFNARSIKNKIADFHARVDVEKPHIIAITESWLDDTFNDGEVFPVDYSVFRNDRNKHGGGVALGIRSNLNPVLKCDFLSNDIEIVWAEFDTKEGKNLFGVYYRPPSQTKNVLDILDDNLSKIHGSDRSYKLCTLVGDFNIHIDWVNEHITKGSLPKRLLDVMHSSGFTQVLNEPTYKTINGIDHFLDLVFVSDPSYVLSCKSTCNLDGCDHSAVEMFLNMSALKDKPISKSVYCLSKADFNHMKYLLVNVPWQLCFDDDINIMWNRTECFIKSCIDESVPKKVVRKNSNLPWMTREIRKLCTKKKRLYKRAKLSKSAVAQQQFKDCSNRLKALIRKSHITYTNSISENFKSNPKKFWSYVASTRKCSDNLSFTIDNDVVNDPITIAAAFNNHFSSKFDDMYDCLDLESLGDPTPSHGGPSFFFDPFTVSEVSEVLHNLDASKSPGPDNILPVFLKECSDELAPVLCDLYNEFIMKGQVPAAWKDANVVPIYKGSGKPKDDVCSYRPVSLTSVLGKVLEKLISSRMMSYINENNVLSDNQFGFRSGRNCEQMLSKFFHLLSKSLDSQKCNLVDGVFLDFSSAFDKVDHNLLLRKLHSLGFRGSVLLWIQNFLFMRRQRVIFKGYMSEWCMVTSGVPQGSVLGPILFLLFVNDISDVVSSPLFQFADDHSIVRPIFSEQDHNILQQDIQNIFHWSLLNKLPLNLSKCSVMHMTRSKSPKFCSSYLMGDVKLVEVDDFKLLGVTFSKDLSFDSQVGIVCDKISKLSGFVIRCSRNMSPDALLNLYKSLVLPHVVYCVCVWAPFQGNHIDRLEKIQRKITRVAFYRTSSKVDRRPDYIERLIDLQLMKLEDVYKFQRLVFGYKLLNGYLPESFNSLVHHSSVNESRLLHVTAKTSCFFNSLFVTLPRLWNGIPRGLQEAMNIGSFKSDCKSFYLKTYS